METIASQFQILVFGQIQLMQLALRHMQARGEGLIINVTSLASRLPVPFMAAYNAAKAALASFTMSIQLELGNSRVHVVDLQPADIRTEFNQGVIKSTKGNPRYDTKIAKTWEVVERNMKNAPTPDLVARTCSQISQLCSAAAAYNSWRCIPIKNCASDFQISSATPSVVGIEEVLPDMTAISEAVILMAGEGSRLRGSDNTFLKPFVPLLGRPLISYALDALIRAGITTVNFVVGYESGRMIEQVKQFLPSDLSASFIENRDWQKQNGISLLAAAGHVSKPFLLTMSDHLFDDAVVDRLLDSSEPGFLNVAVDRKLDSIFDLEDAMKVQTCGDRVTGIGEKPAALRCH